MLVFGIDIPLVEVILALGVIMFIILIEVIIITGILVKQMRDTKKLSVLINKLSETMLKIKKAEIEELNRLKK